MFKFQIYTDHKGEYRWRLVRTGNFKIMADSGEGYSSRQAVIDAIQLIQTYVSSASIEEIKEEFSEVLKQLLRK